MLVFFGFLVRGLKIINWGHVLVHTLFHIHSRLNRYPAISAISATAGSAAQTDTTPQAAAAPETAEPRETAEAAEPPEPHQQNRPQRGPRKPYGILAKSQESLKKSIVRDAIAKAAGKHDFLGQAQVVWDALGPQAKRALSNLAQPDLGKADMGSLLLRS